MKSITLLRHAKSDWDEGGGKDFDRPLTERGRDCARLIGSEMQRRGLAFDRVLASPARRVVETIRQLSEGYGEPIDASFVDELYQAPSRLLLQIVRAMDEPAASLLLVGHNPGLQGLAGTLAGKDSDGLYRRVADRYPTAGLALIEFDCDSWAEIVPGHGRLTAFIKPRELAGWRS